MLKTVDYYISLGLDRKAAEYFASGRKKITAVKPNADCTLTLSFDNGETRLYNVAPLVQKGTVFEFLSDKNNFDRVYLDSERCVAWDKDPNVDSDKVWSNKVDLCPDTCYIDSVPISGATA